MFVTIDGLKLYYTTLGEGTPTLLLHGWGVDSRSMESIMTYLKDRQGTKVYALDFPGFGMSELPPESWEVGDFTALVVQFLDKMGLDKVDIVAHSFGGRVSIKLAAAHPERVNRLVLVDCAGIRPDRTVGYYVKVYTYKFGKALANLLPGSMGTSLQERMAARRGSSDYQQAGEMRATFVKVVNEDLRHLLPDVQAPTLLVWGELDTDTPLQDGRLMDQLIPDSRLEVLPGAGHYCYIDDFPGFSRAVSAFLGSSA
jgi:pimeloyl-ACP methyl ester carboxylesterase